MAIFSEVTCINISQTTDHGIYCRHNKVFVRLEDNMYLSLRVDACPQRSFPARFRVCAAAEQCQSTVLDYCHNPPRSQTLSFSSLICGIQCVKGLRGSPV